MAHAPAAFPSGLHNYLLLGVGPATASRVHRRKSSIETYRITDKTEEFLLEPIELAQPGTGYYSEYAVYEVYFVYEEGP